MGVIKCIFCITREGWATGKDITNQRGILLKYSEDISQPLIPIGPTSGTVNTIYSFTTGGALSSLGHPIEYRFDWGDGAFSDWSSSTSASHSWTSPEMYNVKAQARCKTENLTVSNWSDSLRVTINIVGPDLIGGWATPLIQTCRSAGKNQWCSLKGTFRVTNIGNRDASSTYVKFYLSDNGNFDQTDNFLKSISTGKLKAGKGKSVSVNYNLSPGVLGSGKYVIAVIDPDNFVSETNESNNMVYGPIP